jgi:hypothetical protein
MRVGLGPGAVLSLILVAASACAPGAAPSQSPLSPAAVATQSTAPTGTSQPPGLCGVIPSGTTGTPIYFSDLTDRCPAIGNLDDPDRAGNHGTNGYLVRLKTGPGIEFAAGPDRTEYVSPVPADVRVELDAEMTTGQGMVGITCRRTQIGRAFTEYHLIIGTNGTYDIEGGPPYRSLASGNAAGALRAGVNHIRGDCIGTTLTLYVNGQQVATAQDSQLTGRLNGIFLRSVDAAGVSITLRNLLITTP